jgi:uncharacterized protein (DUF1499 family)
MSHRAVAGILHRRAASWRSALGVATIVVFASGCSGSRPADLGVREGRLLACPSSPNCVSSDASDDEHAIAPLGFDGAPAAAWSALREAIAQMPRAEIIEDTGSYMHVEFTSLLFRYVDDVELDLRTGRPGSDVIAVRSASRLGHSDMGANRDRVEELRTLFDAARQPR